MASLPQKEPIISREYTVSKVDNQGIVDGRPEGEQPSPAKVVLDTYTDPDASASEPFRANVGETLGGITSWDGAPAVEREEQIGLRMPKKEPPRHTKTDRVVSERNREKAQPNPALGLRIPESS